VSVEADCRVTGAVSATEAVTATCDGNVTVFFILIEFVIAVCNFLLGTSFCEVFPLPESLLFISVGAVSDARYFDL